MFINERSIDVDMPLIVLLPAAIVSCTPLIVLLPAAIVSCISLIVLLPAAIVRCERSNVSSTRFIVFVALFTTFHTLYTIPPSPSTAETKIDISNQDIRSEKMVL